MGSCRDCKYRNASHGLSVCELLSNDCTPIPWDEREAKRRARPTGYEAATFEVEDDFGCVHFEQKAAG